MEQQSYESKILDHLGLVAAMFDELELGPEIDRRVAQDFEQRIVSVGQATKAMVLNGLGFVNQRLYLIPAFFLGHAYRAARRPGHPARTSQ